MSSRSPAVAKVPLWRTLGESIRQVLGDLKAVGRLGWPPFMILATFAVVWQFTYPARLARTISAPGAAAPNVQAAMLLMLFGIVALFIQAFCYNAFMVSWYRHVLQASGNVRSGGYWPAFWRTLGYYALVLVGFIVSVSVFSFAAGFIAVIGRNVRTPQTIFPWAAGGTIAVGMIIFFACVARASLVFPAAAYGHSLSLRSAWKRMRGNAWRLIAALCLLSAALLAVEAVPALALNGDAILSLISGRAVRVAPQPIPLAITISVIGKFILLLFLALSASVTATFYRELVLGSRDVVDVFA